MELADLLLSPAELGISVMMVVILALTKHPNSATETASQLSLVNQQHLLTLSGSELWSGFLQYCTIFASIFCEEEIYCRPNEMK